MAPIAALARPALARGLAAAARRPAVLATAARRLPFRALSLSPRLFDAAAPPPKGTPDGGAQAGQRPVAGAPGSASDVETSLPPLFNDAVAPGKPPAADPTLPPPSASAAGGAGGAHVPAEPFVPLPSFDIDTETETARKKQAEQGPQGGRPFVPNMFDYLSGKSGLILTVAGAAYIGWYLFGEDASQEELASYGVKPEDPTPSAWAIAKARLHMNTDLANKFITEPAFENVLPPKIPPERPFTLLVDLEGILTCSKWDAEHGWRTAKRPGADYFLAYLSQFYEIVLFTTMASMNAAPVAEKLDPWAVYMPYRLFRDSTRFEYRNERFGSNIVIKDLANLNRPLETVIMLDTEKSHAARQPDNALILPKWTGDPEDKGLIELIPFLESIGIYAPKDVRPILKAYEDKDVGQEYARIEAQRREIEYRNWAATPQGQRTLAAYDQNQNASPTASSLPSSGWSLSSLFSHSPSTPTAISSSAPSGRPGPPPSYVDQRRAQAQELYRLEQKYFDDHRAEIERQIAEDRERQMKEFEQSPLGQVFGAPAAVGGFVKSLNPFAKKEDAEGGVVDEDKKNLETELKSQSGQVVGGK